MPEKEDVERYDFLKPLQVIADAKRRSRGECEEARRGFGEVVGASRRAHVCICL